MPWHLIYVLSSSLVVSTFAANAMTSVKSINKMDSVLQLVNSQFVTLQEDEKKYFVSHYKSVTEKLIEMMRNQDKLFDNIYKNFYFAGSFYDGLRVGKPDEYDVDVVMKLPINYDTVEFSNKKVKPPFVKVKMTAMKQLSQHNLWTEVYRSTEKWTDQDGFLLQGEFRQWMESVVYKALTSLPKLGNAYQLNIEENIYNITIKKTGPAMTLNVSYKDIIFDVDLVPVIEFKSPKKWPPSPVRQNTVPKRESWFIVPKPNSKLLDEFQDTYWRLAFHEQEREMISGNEMGHLKNACRLLKKFRDKNNFKSIASYYLKTLFLWEIAQRKNDTSFWKSSLSDVFMTMLRKLAENVNAGSIKYFWDDRYNLISGMSTIERSNVENRINKVIKEIEKKSVEDPTIIAFHLLTPDEFKRFEIKYPVPAPANNPTVTEPKPAVLAAAPKPVTKSEILKTDGASIEAIVQILNALQQELVQQRKLTQTVLNKVINLQHSVYALTEDNTMLREELKLSKLSSRNAAAKQEEAHLLSFEFDPAYGSANNDSHVSNDSQVCKTSDYVLNGDTVDALLILDSSEMDGMASLLP